MGYTFLDSTNQGFKTFGKKLVKKKQNKITLKKKQINKTTIYMAYTLYSVIISTLEMI